MGDGLAVTDIPLASFGHDSDFRDNEVEMTEPFVLGIFKELGAVPVSSEPQMSPSGLAC